MGRFDSYQGVIDLDDRKVLHNADGSISTESSFSFSPDGKTEVLIPSVVEGKRLPQKDAIDHFMKTGEHLGTFDTKSKDFSYEGLANYADNIHNRQEDTYRRKNMSELEAVKNREAMKSFEAQKAAHVAKVLADARGEGMNFKPMVDPNSLAYMKEVINANRDPRTRISPEAAAMYANDLQKSLAGTGISPTETPTHDYKAVEAMIAKNRAEQAAIDAAKANRSNAVDRIDMYDAEDALAAAEKTRASGIDEGLAAAFMASARAQGN